MIFFAKVIGLITTLFIVLFLGLLQSDTIVGTAPDSTGPSFEVLEGNIKLKLMMPDSAQQMDYSGIMVKDNYNEVFSSIHYENNLEYDYYFVLSVRIIGKERGDGSCFHPLVEITAHRLIAKIHLWLLVVMDLASCFVIFLFRH